MKTEKQEKTLNFHAAEFEPLRFDFATMTFSKKLPAEASKK